MADDTTMTKPSGARGGLSAFCQATGLHPLVGFGVAAVDAMLFGEEAVTAGAGWVVSLPVGVLVAVAATLIQRHSFKDGWGAALGKGLLLGVLTAIPTAIPGIALSLGATVPGVAKYLLGPKKD